jgi:hypothetical protein
MKWHPLTDLLTTPEMEHFNLGHDVEKPKMAETPIINPIHRSGLESQ